MNSFSVDGAADRGNHSDGNKNTVDIRGLEL